MAKATFIGHDTLPNYICLSTDINSSVLIGAAIQGYTVLATDTGNWYLIDNTNTLVSYTLPTSGGGSGGGGIVTNAGTFLVQDNGANQGSMIETAPTTDTASSGINGRLQRVAQRITSLIALLPAALGVGGGLKIDGSGTALPISGTVTANTGGLTDTQLRATAVPISVASLPSQNVTNVGVFAVQADTELPSASALTDAMTNPTTSTIATNNMVWNGSTWDRTKEPTGDALSVTGLQSVGNMVWNGSSWDRAQSDTTGKTKVSLYGNSAAAGDTSLVVAPSAGNSAFATSAQPLATVLGLWDNGLVKYFPASVIRGLSDAAVGDNQLTTAAYAYNNSTYDRIRNNHEVTILASASRSADTNSSDQNNYNARGVVVTVDLTVLGSTNITFTITYKDSLSGKYVTLLASSALVGTGTISLTVYPSTTVSANASISMPLPKVWRISSVRGGSPGSDTYSISANYIL